MAPPKSATATEPMVLVPKRPSPSQPAPTSSPPAKRTSRIVVQRAAPSAVTSELTDASKGPMECPPGRVLKTVHGKRFCAKVKPPSPYAQPPWLREHAFTSDRQPAKRGSRARSPPVPA
jgi:hypothetical protein